MDFAFGKNAPIAQIKKNFTFASHLKRLSIRGTRDTIRGDISMCFLAAKAKNEKLDQRVHDGVATQSCGCLSLNSVLRCTPIFLH